MSWQKMQKIIWVTFLVLVFVSILIYEIYGENFDLEIIREYLQGADVWAPLIFIVLYTIGTIFIPSTPFMAVAGILFGFKYGLIYTIIGGFFSSVLVFEFSRRLGGNYVENFLKNKYFKYLDKYNRRLGKNGIKDLIILRILPIMPFNVLNILMGVSKMTIQNYMIATLIGLIPSNILTVYFGDLIADILF